MINIEDTGPFQSLYDLPENTSLVICIGGRGGRKTYEVSKFAAFSATIKNKRVAVLRDEKETIRESILNEIFLRFDTANQHGHFNGMFDKTERGIRDLKTGEMVVFTKGFRASSLVKTANLKSISDVDIAIIEEAEDIRDHTKYNTFSDSIRKEGSLIIIVLNTPDVNHWLIKRYFHLEPVEQGYFNIIPKIIPGFHCIQTSFEDNPYLPAHIVEQYKGYGNPDSHLYDNHYYLTAIKGYASEGRFGQIYTHYELCDELPMRGELFSGIDFGYNVQTAGVMVEYFEDSCYVDEVLYETRLTTQDLIDRLNEIGIPKTMELFCDNAEPKAIEELCRAGFNAIPADKDVTEGIRKVKSKRLFITRRSRNLIEELKNYIWKVDKNGIDLDEPLKFKDHLCDSLRYAIFTKLTQKEMTWVAL